MPKFTSSYSNNSNYSYQGGVDGHFEIAIGQKDVNKNTGHRDDHYKAIQLIPSYSRVEFISFKSNTTLRFIDM